MRKPSRGRASHAIVPDGRPDSPSWDATSRRMRTRRSAPLGHRSAVARWWRHGPQNEKGPVRGLPEFLLLIKGVGWLRGEDLNL